MAKLSITANVDNKKQPDIITVYLRLTHDKTRTLHSLDIKGSREMWNTETHSFRIQEGRKKLNYTVTINNCPSEPEKANDLIASRRQEASDIIEKLDKQTKFWTVQMFKDNFAPKAERKFFYSFVVEKMAECEKEGRHKSASIMADAIKSFKAFDGKFEEMEFENINRAYIKRYQEWSKANGHKINTQSIRLRQIRALLNKARYEGIYEGANFPFGEEGVKIGGKLGTKRESYISWDNLAKMYLTDIDNKYSDMCRHLYITSVKMRGVNWRDMAEFTTDNIVNLYGKKYISYTRSKTDVDYLIHINKDVQKELDWFKANTTLFKNHLFPIIRKNIPASKKSQYLDESRRRCTEKLRILWREMGINENLSFYSARHSLATRVNELYGSMAAGIVLGHNTKTVTDAYIAQTRQQEIDRFADLAFHALDEEYHEEKDNSTLSEQVKCLGINLDNFEMNDKIAEALNTLINSMKKTK